ncbi:unnamed protein product [Echinostoma caproni]|uniref:Uncharacterized protein n=1 Tax=Echinostoma caproni TaxID=27848 RepID=A0A183BDQ7_9TREM|nr:unnamed protein product [Echinostoma caproni]
MLLSYFPFISVRGPKYFPVMVLPEDDSDLLGKSVEQLNSDLSHRDTIIKHKLIDELTVPDTSQRTEENEVNEFIARSTIKTRLKWVFFPE